jgi:hypothetical protein
MKRQIMIINPVGSLLVLLAALALAVFISRRWWRTVRKDVTDGVTIKPEQAETPEFLAQPVKITGVTGRIIAAYRAFLTLTERACGIRLTPPMTLREFLSSVTKLLPGITRPLASLTDMMERALYSHQKPSRETAVTAEQLSVNIKEELGHEAS